MRPSTRFRWFVALALLALLASSCDAAPTPQATAAGSESIAPTNGAGSPEPPGTPGPGATPGAPLPEEVTPADLIAEAEVAGLIDHATALRYRVYALFEDPRLPGEYLGDAWGEDNAAIDEIRLRPDTVPPDLLADLAPYLARPTNPSSAFFAPTVQPPVAADTGAILARAIRPVDAGPIAAAAPTCTQGNWAYLDGTNAFRVWGSCADPGAIERVVAWMNPLWIAETGYMRQEPVPDGGSVDQGADPDDPDGDIGAESIDIYLVNSCVHRNEGCRSAGRYATTFVDGPTFGPPGAQTSSAYIVLSTGLLGNDVLARAVLAHEFFHVLQRAFNSEGARIGTGSYWFEEASAVWAQWRFVPEASRLREPTMTPYRFSSFQGTIYGLHTGPPANHKGSFAWPLYMEQTRAGSVAAAWAAMRGATTYDALNRAIDGVLPFEGDYHKFAVRAYNRQLAPGLTSLLPGPAVGEARVIPWSQKIEGPTDLLPNAPGNVWIYGYRLPSLAITYRHLRVDDEIGQLIFDFSTMRPNSDLSVDALFLIDGKWELREMETGKTTLCRDVPADKVDEMIIVLSNHQVDHRSVIQRDWTIDAPRDPCRGYYVKIDWTETWGTGAVDHAVFEGLIDRLEDEVIGDVAYLTGTGTVSGIRAGWASCSPDIDTPEGTSVAAEFGAVIDGDDVTISAFAGLMTPLSGLMTELLVVPKEGIESMFIFGENPTGCGVSKWSAEISVEKRGTIPGT